MSTEKPASKRARDAITGEFVTPEHAEQNPDTTVVETIKPGRVWEVPDTTKTATVDLVFDGPPGHEAPRFVESHFAGTDLGVGGFGQWVDLGNGQWALRVQVVVTDGLPPLPERPTARTLIAAERQRQIDDEGYAPEHDAAHGPGSLISAATAYYVGTGYAWPWEPEAFKPKNRLRDLIRAGALAQAALDLDPTAATTKQAHVLRARIAVEIDEILDEAARILGNGPAS